MKQYELVVDTIRAIYPPSKLQEMFVKRLDDNLFAQVGELAHSNLPKPQSVWLGFEILTDSHKCPQSLRIQ